MVKEAHKKWIREHIPTAPNDCLNLCEEATLAMKAAFPELTRVRGFVLLSVGYERPHWWLEERDGEIVDPTATQWQADYYGGPNTRVVSRRAWQEGMPEPTGKCPNCGGPCYNGQTCCGDNCHREYAAYCSR